MRLGSQKRKGIVTGGTWCADHNKCVSHWPGEEEVVEILTNEVRGGGSACNLAIDLKRLDPDFSVSTIGLIGDDEDGRTLIAEADCRWYRPIRPSNRRERQHIAHRRFHRG